MMSVAGTHNSGQQIQIWGEGGGALLEASMRHGSGNNEQRQHPVWCLGQIRGGGMGVGEAPGDHGQDTNCSKFYTESSGGSRCQ